MNTFTFFVPFLHLDSMSDFYIVALNFIFSVLCSYGAYVHAR
jgi:hypothetical protein